MGLLRNGGYRFGQAVIAGCLLLCNQALAQNAPTSTPPPPPADSTGGTTEEGKDIGGFRVMQSVELGGRISDVTGSQAMYNTLVNDQSGPRILDQSLTMQSLTHQDW